MSYKKTQAVLNQAVADLSQFAVIIHQAHWYMRGDRFLTLHPKMDDFMDEVNAQLDEIAERLITIGGAPYSTLGEFSSNTKLKDKKGDFKLTINDHLQTLLDGYQYIAGLYAQGIDVSEKEGDDVTNDLFIGLKGAIEKNIWMVSATLGKESRVEALQAVPV